MMEQRRAGMDAGKDEKCVGEKFMRLESTPRRRPIGRPRRRDIPKSEDRQSLAAHEVHDNADERHRDKERIERPMAHPRGDLQQPAKLRRLDGRRRIGKSPDEPRKQITP